MAQNAQEWGIELCNALGLDPSVVTRIQIELDAAKPVTVTVMMRPNKSAAVVEVLRGAGKHVEHVTVIDLPGPQLIFETIADLPGGNDGEIPA